MKELILLRHAKSSWDLNVSDKERPLTEKGINRIKMISAVSSNILSSADLKNKTITQPTTFKPKKSRYFAVTGFFIYHF